MELGSNIRRLRQARDLTLAQLASKAQITPSLLSQVERGVANPSLNSLRGIANALAVPLVAFFEEDPTTRPPIVRSPHRRKLKLPEENVTFELLSPGLDQKIEFLQFTLPPGLSTSDDLLGHLPEEAILVTEGTMRLDIQQDSYILEAGDSAHIISGLPHKLTNAGDKPATAICALTPPLF